MLDIIIEECKKNQPKAQEQLYQLFAKKLFGMCLKYSTNYTDAQDNFQEGFLIVFQKIGQYNGQGSFEGWAKRIMINNALKNFKEVRYLEVLNENYPVIEVEIEEQNVPLEYLLQIIQELPDQYRIVFSLYVLDDYSHKEISELLSISTGTSKSNLHRARIVLKEKIENRMKSNTESSAK